MSARVLFAYLFLIAPALAQGFAGLGDSAAGFRVPQQGVSLQFPADHGAHPEYRIEWWYITANLKGADGRSYGAQWTLFRSALAPRDEQGWSSPQLWMGHAAITTAEEQRVAERLARGGIGQAGVTLSPFAARIDDWAISSEAPSAADELSKLRMSAAGLDFSYDLFLSAAGPLVMHGDKGYSRKSDRGQASYYYSQPSYEVSGELRLPGNAVAVSGKAWLDHEWSSQPLAPDQKGWDWFALHFDSGEKLMGFRLRDSGAGYTSGTWINRDGSAEALPSGGLVLTPLQTAEVAGRHIPVAWRIQVPSKNLDVSTKALNPQSWMKTQVPYWEGPVTLSGSHTGEGYVEMTGYDQQN